eukprot:3551468-Karenia_brevis.AAC.1
MAHPGPPKSTMHWISERDRQTRVKVRALHTEGWPFGEALTQTTQTHMAVLWTVGNTIPAGSPEA